MPETATELEVLETKNDIFNRSFVEVMVESAAKVRPAEASRTMVMEDRRAQK